MKTPKRIIRSTKTHIEKFANTNKLANITNLIAESKLLLQYFIDKLWEMEKIPTLLPKEITENIPTTWLSARMIQCIGKQASSITRGTRQKHKQRLAQLNIFTETGQFKKARKLQTYCDKVKISKPNVKNIKLELDPRFIKTELTQDEKTGFCWITIASIGKKDDKWLKIIIPFKLTKHFNKLNRKGKLLNGIRLSETYITFNFEMPIIPKKEQGKIKGVDIGVVSLLSCSDGFQSKKDKDGHDLNSICDKLKKKKCGSKGFEKVCQHRKNYINWSVKQFSNESLGETKILKLEGIKGLFKGRNVSKKLKRFVYREIFDKLEDYCYDYGVHVETINPTYTSQRCSRCGWVRKANRKKKKFKCDKCFFEHDADLNASMNISLDLPPIWKKERLMQKNRTGFYWLAYGQVPIVPVAL